jgi:hypothetical protein
MRTHEPEKREALKNGIAARVNTFETPRSIIY